MAKLDKFLKLLLEHGGSDLHLGVGQPLRYRVNGELEVYDNNRYSEVAVRLAMQEICPADCWEEFLAKKDLDFAYAVEGLGRFRTNFYVDAKGMGAVLRYIPTKIPTLQELNLPDALMDLCKVKSGLVLITGPTGSGKSTTLAAMIDYINHHTSKHIITIEEPIEFIHKNHKSFIEHCEIGVHSPSFPLALRSAMREDPDIILLGEMRDLESIRAGLSCAAMGVLVFSTLHTNNAPKTIDRLIDAFPVQEQPHIRTLLAESLRGIASQILCRRKQGGRVAAHEVLLWVEGLPNSIRSGQVSNICTLIEANKALGMRTMDSSLQELMLAGIISAEEAYMKASDKKLFQDYIAFS